MNHKVTPTDREHRKKLTSILHFVVQKIFSDLISEGIPVIESSTLTEEGVMQVKTEVKHIRRLCFHPLITTTCFTPDCAPPSGMWPSSGSSGRLQDERKEGPWRPEPSSPGHAQQEGRQGEAQRRAPSYGEALCSWLCLVELELSNRSTKNMSSSKFFKMQSLIFNSLHRFFIWLHLVLFTTVITFCFYKSTVILM